MLPDSVRIGTFRRYFDSPMGQGLAESQLIMALRRRNAHIVDVPAASMRATAIGGRRFPVERVSRLPWRTQALAGRALYRGFDIVHRLDLGLPPAPVPEVLTVHDLAPTIFSDEGAFPRSAARSIASAAAVVTVSRFSASEITRLYGRGDVDVVPNGVDPDLSSAGPLPQAERLELGLPSRWVLHTGGATARKNLAELAGAWSRLSAEHADVGLVLCGPQDPRRTALFGDLPRTWLLGRVERGRLLRLMASAAAVVVPSTYEGFGLPALEAMALGVPLVVADAASLPEIAGPGAVVVAPTAAALADGISVALRGVSPAQLAAAQTLAEQYTWDRAAAAYEAIYARVGARAAGQLSA